MKIRSPISLIKTNIRSEAGCCYPLPPSLFRLLCSISFDIHFKLPDTTRPRTHGMVARTFAPWRTLLAMVHEVINVPVVITIFEVNTKDRRVTERMTYRHRMLRLATNLHLQIQIDHGKRIADR
jgi:hypothetical protein